MASAVLVAAAFVAIGQGALALPNLQVQVSAASGLQEGSPVAVNVTVSNSGNEGAANTTVVLAIDGNPTDPPLEFPPLGAGAASTQSTPFTLSCGYHNLSATVDPGGSVTEISESDNNATGLAKVLPYAAFSTTLGVGPGVHNLTANASLSHGCAPLSFAWQAAPGGLFYGEQFSLDAPAGNLTITLTAASLADATLAGQSTRVLAVPNLPPQLEVTAGALPIPTGSALMLTIVASDPDGFVEAYRVDFGDGNSTANLAEASGHKYARPGDYEVIVRATDNLGGFNESTLMVTVLNRVPIARVDPPYWYGELGQEAVLNGTASRDPEGGPLSYAWQFGDGNGASGPTAFHSYGAPGVYNAVLTVTDEAGATHSTTVRIQVLPKTGESGAGSLLTAAFLAFVVVFVVVYVVRIRGQGPPPEPKPPPLDEKAREKKVT